MARNGLHQTPSGLEQLNCPIYKVYGQRELRYSLSSGSALNLHLRDMLRSIALPLVIGMNTSIPDIDWNLNCSEWRDPLKMTGNVAPVRAVSGRTQDNNHCRRCHSEVETLAHVLSSCPFGETLRNSRHHKIRSVIATSLKSNGYTTYEEVHGIADTEVIGVLIL
ncbi:hypothetical protein ANN_21914 [Periplaneta americana]|uniref:Reverse transcriptase zinc-binding domain-containing protein n=1 Tax=Periplaneta americana TaxID=6978 RepID=A0ABQ8S764_PERAM|nr:hypothetical protein ANN_21914 [Periplaneta americana]